MQRDCLSGVLSVEEEQALRLAGSCFGVGSPEHVRLLRYLVCEVHGLPWLDEPVFRAAAAGAPR